MVRYPQVTTSTDIPKLMPSLTQHEITEPHICQALDRALIIKVNQERSQKFTGCLLIRRLPGEQQLYAQELSLQAENKEREAHTLSTVSS